MCITPEKLGVDGRNNNLRYKTTTVMVTVPKRHETPTVDSLCTSTNFFFFIPLFLRKNSINFYSPCFFLIKFSNHGWRWW
ncbi:unnamed protein product [Rotaria magnacalcarata]